MVISPKNPPPLEGGGRPCTTRVQDKDLCTIGVQDKALYLIGTGGRELMHLLFKKLNQKKLSFVRTCV